MSGHVVLLTGATGFVGRQIRRSLAAHDVGVRVVVREQSQAKLEHADQAESIVVTQDLFAESADWWAQTCQGVDAVIHAAWYAEPGLYLQSAKNLDCLIGTLQLAKGAVQAGVQRFIGLGTCFEYDLTFGRLSVDTPLNPLTPYAGAKASAFLTLAQVLPQQNIQFAWCRLFYLFGEGEDPRRFVPYLRSRLSAGEPAELTTGEQIRDFLDVGEAGALIAEYALSSRQGPVNVCSGQGIQVRELAERIADEYGRRDLLKFGARPPNLVDPPCVVGVRG
jgi:nucleoside-diphosphate-sugar epimerase